MLVNGVVPLVMTGQTEIDPHGSGDFLLIEWPGPFADHGRMGADLTLVHRQQTVQGSFWVFFTEQGTGDVALFNNILAKSIKDWIGVAFATGDGPFSSVVRIKWGKAELFFALVQ